MSIGIDVGGTSVKLAVMRPGGEVVERKSGTYRKPARADLVDALREVGADLAPADVGICVPGVREGTVVKLSVNVPGLNGVELGGLVEDAWGWRPGKVMVTTDACAAGVDIWRTRGLAGRVMVLSLGTGVGGVVLDDGVMLRVDGESSGHFGQMDCGVEGEAVVGPDGGAGGLEGYVGAAAIRERYGKEGVRAMAGDDAPVRALAKAIRIGHAIYRPMHVVLAGGVGVRMGHVVDALRGHVERGLTRIAREGWTLSAGESDYHAARGAARMAGSPR